jgi:outer membrane protein TolC
MKTTILSALLMSAICFSQDKFSDLNQFLSYASNKSVLLKTNDIRIKQAKKAKLAAMLGVVDPTGHTQVNFTNNLQLPVNLVNGQSLVFGTKYNTGLVANADLKLLNLQGWEQLNLAKINIALNESNALLARQQWQEHVAMAYYNVVLLQAQLPIKKNYAQLANELHTIVLKKQQAGLAKVQDVNDSQINVLQAQSAIEQLNIGIQQYEIALKILADIPESERFVLDEKLDQETLSSGQIIKQSLSLENQKIKENYAFSALKQQEKSFYPSISLFFGHSSQQYNSDFTLWGGQWVNSHYVGLKLNLNMPTAQSIANWSKAKFDHQIAQAQSQQANIKAELDQQQLGHDLAKAITLCNTQQATLLLRKDTYQKHKNLYQEGLLSLESTLNSYQAMLNTHDALLAAQASKALAQAKINIHNQPISS